jgi:class 3 adenylate cyclase
MQNPHPYLLKSKWTLEFEPSAEERYLTSFQRDIRLVSIGFAIACIALVSFALTGIMFADRRMTLIPENVIFLWIAVALLSGLLLAASALNIFGYKVRWLQLGCLTTSFFVMNAGALNNPGPFGQSLFDNARIFISTMAFFTIPTQWRLLNLVLCTATLLATRQAMSGELPAGFAIATLATVSVGFWGSVVLEKVLRRNFALGEALVEEQQRSSALLKSIFPGPIFDRVKNQETPAFFDRFDDVSIIFADIVGFTPFAAERSPEEVVSLLDQIISRLDASCAHAGALKIKTIGDGYLAALGLPDRDPDHYLKAADLALEFREAVKKVAEMTGVQLSMRIGIHCGSVVAGIMGRSTPHFDLWGDTVNIAARIESTGIPGEIQASEHMAHRLAGRFRFTARGDVQLKGRGAMKIFTLIGPNLTPAPG